MDLLGANSLAIKEQSIIVPVLRAVQSPVSALSSIHQQYGDLVFARFFDQKLLFVCQPEHVEEIYAQEARGLLSRDFLCEAKKTLFRNGLVNSKAEIWSKQRRLMQPIFTKDAVVEWEKVFIDGAQSLVDTLKMSVPGQINLSDHLKQLIQRIFIQVLMGRSVDTIPESEQLRRAIEQISQGLLPHLVSEIIGKAKLMWLMSGKSRNYHTAVKRLSDFISQEIDKNQQTAAHSLISVMRQASDKKTGYVMSKELLIDETINLFFAGQDTTLNTLAWFFYLIGRDASVHHKVSDEIRKFNGEPINTRLLENLTYTRAVLNETLRLYPPSPALSTQAIEDIEIGGYSVNKGTVVILSMYATHHHAGLWEKPNEFYPEHFLNPELQSERHKYAFFPFGGGVHNCIGRHFAELEMMIIIVTMLRAFTFETLDDIKEASSITLKPKKDVISLVKFCTSDT